MDAILQGIHIFYSVLGVFKFNFLFYMIVLFMYEMIASNHSQGEFKIGAEIPKKILLKVASRVYCISQHKHLIYDTVVVSDS